jgi:hypothetical protein
MIGVIQGKKNSSYEGNLLGHPEIDLPEVTSELVHQNAGIDA